MQAVDAQIHDRLLAFPLHGQFQFPAALVHRLLDAGGMDTAVGNQALQGHAGNLTAGLIKAGQGDGFRRVVDDQVTAGGGLQSTDVAALTADDTALHLIVGQRDNTDRRLAGGIGGTAGNGLAHHLTGHIVALVLEVGLIGGNAHRLLVGEFLIQALQQHGTGVLLGHAGDGFQLLGLAQLELFQLVQAGFHQLTALFQILFLALDGGGALVQRLLLLVHTALLPGDLGTALLDFLIRLGLELECFVLGLDDGFLAFLFR